MAENNFNSNEIDIDRLSRLARIEIPEKDRAAIASELKKMAEYTYPRVICEDGALPFSFETGSAAPRPDEARTLCESDRALIMSNAPSEKDGYITVPKIIKEEK